MKPKAKSSIAHDFRSSIQSVKSVSDSANINKTVDISMKCQQSFHVVMASIKNKWT